MATRSEFRFVVDGIDLTQEQQTKIASAIQRAGLEALNGAAQVSLINPVIVGHVNPTLRREWYGMWLADGPIGADLGQRINDLGFYQ